MTITMFTEWDGTNLKEIVELISGSIEKNQQVIELGWDDYRTRVKIKGLSIKTFRGWEAVGIGDKIIKSGNHITLVNRPPENS